MTLATLETYLAAAEDAAGSDDWGDADDPGFRARVGTVVANANAVGLDPAGEEAFGQTIGWHLTTRLRLFADRKRFRIGEKPVRQPIIATGEPRSGTTLLHALLAEDPEARAPRFWEIYYPSPPPGANGDDDARRAQADDDWRDILDRIPRWLVSHPYNDMLGDGLPECERLWAIDFRSTPPSGWWRVPALGLGAGLPQDHARQYEIHRMHLQQLQFAGGATRWALKGTSHHRRLAALLDAYPDAHIVWTHRDPVQTTASFLELFAQIQEGIAGSVDRTAMAANLVASTRATVQQIMSDPCVEDPRIVHVRYHDLVADPVAVIGDAYSRFGMSTDDAHVTRMKSWLAANRSDRYGKFTYAVDALGVSVDELYAELEPYFQRFGVRREVQR